LSLHSSDPSSLLFLLPVQSWKRGKRVALPSRLGTAADFALLSNKSIINGDNSLAITGDFGVIASGTRHRHHSFVVVFESIFSILNVLKDSRKKVSTRDISIVMTIQENDVNR
jgi:hypothetical protein